MPTTFNVISLGQLADIDTTEGNTTAENASALVGLTLGDLYNPLWEQAQTFSQGATGYAGGTSTAYDMNNTSANETFKIDGGADQTFDGTSIYNATITYVDGTTATITAVIFQDVNGNAYLAPEFSANADQVALEAEAIRSLTLDSLVGNGYSGLSGSRETSNFAVCFAAGTRIRTPDGDRPVETLKAGDLVITADAGPQPIRWINGRSVPAVGAMQPIRIEQGALGHGLPSQPLIVSQQHRMMVRSPVAKRMFGADEVLIAAKKLVPIAGFDPVEDMGVVDYWHFMCDCHHVVFANDAPAETLFLGAQARLSLGAEALAEVTEIFPELAASDNTMTPARPLASGAPVRSFTKRLLKNSKHLVEAA